MDTGGPLEVRDVPYSEWQRARVLRLLKADQRRRWHSLSKVLARLTPRAAALYMMLPPSERALVTGFLYGWAEGHTESVGTPDERWTKWSPRYRIERQLDPMDPYWFDERIGWEARAVILELFATADRDSVDIETFLALILCDLGALVDALTIAAPAAVLPPGDPPPRVDLLVRSVRPTNGPNAAAPTCALLGHAWALAA